MIIYKKYCSIYKYNEEAMHGTKHNTNITWTNDTTV